MCGRKFDNVDQMGHEIIDQYNKCAARSDTLVILGDFAWRDAAKWRRLIKCKDVHLIRGNHDKASDTRNFNFVRDTHMYRLGDSRFKCWASHYPHAIWPASHYGSFHIYGHCHWQREGYLDDRLPNRRSMDVGVDTAFMTLGKYRPFSEVEIINILGNRQGHHDLDHEKSLQEWLNSEC